MNKFIKFSTFGGLFVVLLSLISDSWAPPPGQEAPPSRHDRRWNS